MSILRSDSQNTAAFLLVIRLAVSLTDSRNRFFMPKIFSTTSGINSSAQAR